MKTACAFARDVVRKETPLLRRQTSARRAARERRHLSQGHTMAERRAAPRLSREQSTLSIDAKTAISVVELRTAQSLLHDEAPGFEDELDDDPVIDDGHFYDEVLRTYDHQSGLPQTCRAPSGQPGHSPAKRAGKHVPKPRSGSLSSC